MTDYYQNHRRYVKSRDDVQLLAGKDDLVAKHQDCDPYDIDESAGKPIAPCGAIANSLFNDTFFLIKCTDAPCQDLTEENLRNPNNISGRIPMTGEGIAWSTDKVKKSY